MKRSSCKEKTPFTLAACFIQLREVHQGRGIRQTQRESQEIHAKGQVRGVGWPCDWEFPSAVCLQSLGSSLHPQPYVPQFFLLEEIKGWNPGFTGLPLPCMWAHFFLHHLDTFVISSSSQTYSNPLLFTLDCFVFNVAYKDFMCFCFINVILLLLWQSASIFFRSGNCIFIVSCSQRDKLPCISHRH